MMAQPPNVVAAIDVGNHRVLALVAELDSKRELVIRGVGLAGSAGVRAGQVVQMKPLVEAIRVAAEEAELMAKTPVERVYASVAGTFLTGRTTRAAITLGGREREVAARDLAQLDEAVRRQPLPPGHGVLNVITHSYALDDQEGILDPQQMLGRQLAVDAYVIACQESPVRTLEKAINAAGLEVEEMLFAPVAAALATLTLDERRLGAVMIDVGFGATGYAAFANDRLVAAGCFPIGAQKINDDIVHRFQTTAEGAERAKRQAGTVLLADVGEEETISVPTIDGRATHVISRRDLCQTIHFRMEETLGLVLADVTHQVAQDASFTGVVLSGGGAHMDGVADLAEKVFFRRARLGELEGVADATQLLNTPELPARSPAVAVGLLAYGSRASLPALAPHVKPRKTGAGLFSRLARKVISKREVTDDSLRRPQ
jgi:cell division protein FtsA